MNAIGGSHAISSPVRTGGSVARWSTALSVAVLAVLAAGIVVAISRVTTGGVVSTIDTSGWVHVLDRDTGFTDRLPAQPRDVTLPAGDFGGTHVTFHLALVGGPAGAAFGARNGPRIAIEDGEITPGLPADVFVPNLRSAIFGFVASSGFDLLSQGGGRFHGRPAWHGTFRGHGTDYQAVAFMESTTRLFMIVTTSQVFDAVTANFQTIAIAEPTNPASTA